MADIPRITPDEVAERLARGDAVAFLDARSAHAMERATEQIPASTRVPADDIDRHVTAIPKDAVAVAYCT
ncbi:MAG: rhodanese-like domain-containing protein [Anaeromyxobacteraceae bacterium]